jgi:hypothetical protein
MKTKDPGFEFITFDPGDDRMVAYIRKDRQLHEVHLSAAEVLEYGVKLDRTVQLTEDAR